MTRWSTFEIFRHTRTSTTRNDQWRTRLRIIDDAARDPKNPLHKLWSHHTRGRALRNDLSVFHKNEVSGISERQMQVVQHGDDRRACTLQALRQAQYRVLLSAQSDKG